MGAARLLDELPRMTVDVGSRRWPAFRLMGVVGLLAAVCVGLLAGLRVGVNPVVVIGLAAASTLTSLTWMLLRRLVTGSEKMVQLWDTWVVLAGAATFGLIVDQPILPLLDILSVGIATFLVFGRVGCAMVGCCHGKASGAGLRYGPEFGLPPELTCRPLVPVQLVESVGMLVIGGGGLALIAGRPGTALVWFLLAGGVLRFSADALRGDRRLHVGWLSSVRLMAVLQFAAGVVLSEHVARTSSTERVLAWSVIAVTLAVGLAFCALGRGDRNPLTTAGHLAEVRETVERLKVTAREVEPVVGDTTADMRIAVTADAAGYHVSVSHPEHDAAEAARALGGVEVARANGITHFRLDDAVTTVRPDPAAMPLPVRATVHADLGSADTTIDGRRAYFTRRPASSRHATLPADDDLMRGTQ